jgi:hypothetical protein
MAHRPAYRTQVSSTGELSILARCTAPGCQHSICVTDQGGDPWTRIKEQWAEHSTTPHQTLEGGAATPAVSEPRSMPTPTQLQSTATGHGRLPSSVVAGILFAMLLVGSVGLVTWAVGIAEGHRDDRVVNSLDYPGADDFGRDGGADNDIGTDPEVLDNGPDRFTVGSFPSSARVEFLTTLRGVDSSFESVPDRELTDLAVEICEALSNGNTREEVIDLIIQLGGWNPMSAARLVVASDKFLC